MFFQLLLTVLVWQGPSFIEQSIASARETIAKEPNKPEGYNDLAFALARKNRETGDNAWLAQAESAVQTSLKLEPANFNGRRARVAIRLREHRYEDALEEAEALRKQRPDENSLYAQISDAQIAIGNYGDAEKAVQRMLDLRGVNSPGYEAGAALRELIGFPAGAIEWWNSALHLVSDRDREERAFILSQIARLYREMGKYDAGADSAQAALELEPEYPVALYELARIRLEQKRPGEAVEVLLARQRKVDDLQGLYWLGAAQKAGGDEKSAVSTLQKFEKGARAAMHSSANENALLIDYLVGHGAASEAIALAEDSLSRRHDLFTRRAYALALSGAGRAADAERQIQLALEPGILDSGFYFDAGVIARQNHDPATALRYFKKAFEMNMNGPNSSEILSELTAANKLSPN